MVQAVYAKLTLTPSIMLKEEFNDNIYLSPDHEEDDLITTISPSVKLTYEAKLVTLSLDYSLLTTFYVHNSKENDIYHKANLDALSNLYKDILYLHITDTYTRVPIDEKKQTGIDNILTNMTDTNTFEVNPYIVYPLTPTLQLRADYIYEYTWYEKESGDDTKNHTLSLSLTKNFFEKLKTTVTYSYFIHRPDLTEEYDRQSAQIHAEYLLGPRLTLRGEYGHQWYNYDSSSIDDKEFNFWDAGLNYKLSEALTFDASYKVDFVESVSTGTYKSKRYEGSLSYSKFITSTFRAFHSKAEYLEQDREDKSNGISLDLTMPFTEKLSGTITGTYTKYTFKPEDRKDKRYGLRLALYYELKITTLSVGYTYNKNNSTDNSKEYTNNIIWAQARITF